MQFMVEGHEYRIGGGDFFAYMPGQVISELMLSIRLLAIRYNYGLQQQTPACQAPWAEFRL